MCLETALAPFPGSCVREPLFGNIPAIAWKARLAWGAWGLNESYSVYIPCAREWEALVNLRVLVQWLTIGAVMPMLASHLSLWVCQLSCDLCWFNTSICHALPLHVALWLWGYFFFSFIKGSFRQKLTQQHFAKSSADRGVWKDWCDSAGDLLSRKKAGMGRMSL